MSNDALILDLSADLAPVRRRHMAREAGLVAALGAVELALVLALGLFRPDMSHMGHSPYLVWRVGSLAGLAAIACGIAIRSYAPTARPRRGLMLMAALAVLAVIGGAFVAPDGASGLDLVGRLDPARGVVCAGSISVLSLPVVGVLGVLMRRAAPTQPGLSALASGFAAGAVGALVFAFCCPFNDPLYVVVWYPIGCAAVAAAARWRLPRRFRLCPSPTAECVPGSIRRVAAAAPDWCGGKNLLLKSGAECAMTPLTKMTDRQGNCRWRDMPIHHHQRGKTRDRTT